MDSWALFLSDFDLNDLLLVIMLNYNDLWLYLYVDMLRITFLPYPPSSHSTPLCSNLLYLLYICLSAYSSLRSVLSSGRSHLLIGLVDALKLLIFISVGLFKVRALFIRFRGILPYDLYARLLCIHMTHIWLICHFSSISLIGLYGGDMLVHLRGNLGGLGCSF